MTDEEAKAELFESKMIFVGLVGILDTAREEAKQYVR